MCVVCLGLSGRLVCGFALLPVQLLAAAALVRFVLVCVNSAEDPREDVCLRSVRPSVKREVVVPCKGAITVSSV